MMTWSRIVELGVMGRGADLDEEGVGDQTDY